MKKRTDLDLELQVIAMLARGDTHEAIHKETGLAITTVAQIKKRNPKALATIADRLVAHKATRARQLLDKTQSIIESKLDRVSDSEAKRDKYFQQFRDGLLSYEEYRDLVVNLTDASLTELNAISKEAFHQSQIESGKPTSIAANSPHEAKEELLALAQAIKDGDEVVLERIVFGGNK